MILSDAKLLEIINSKQLLIEPINNKTIQQNGIDFTVSNELAVGKPTANGEPIDASSSDSIKDAFQVMKCIDSAFIVEPLKNYLLTTQEYIRMPKDIMGFCGLRSTFARLGFVSPLTIIDAGFEGMLTIATFYGGSAPIKIPVGSRFLHVVFAKLLSDADHPYEGQYKNQKGVSLPKALV